MPFCKASAPDWALAGAATSKVAMIAAAKYLVVMSLSYKANVTELLPQCPLSMAGLSDNQWNSSKAQVAIGRPARSNPPLSHQYQSVGVGARAVLFRALFGSPCRFGPRGGVA